MYTMYRKPIGSLIFLTSLLFVAAPVQAGLDEVPAMCPSECAELQEGVYVVLASLEPFESDENQSQATSNSSDPVCIDIRLDMLVINLTTLNLNQILNPLAGTIGIDLDSCIDINMYTGVGTSKVTNLFP